jgi:Rrf2 family iron-sulfur cluster assembly transcriptional regulator
MKLTTKGRFAVTAMLDLAMRQAKGPVTLAGISERQGISLSYLEQLFGKLRRHQIVSSVRGPGGGYRLARKGADITVADIIFAVNEPMDTTMCGGAGNCHHKSDEDPEKRCITHDLWSALNVRIVDFLDSVTVQDMVDQQHQKAREQSADSLTTSPRAVAVA